MGLSDYTDEIKKAMAERRYENAFSIAIKGLRDARRENNQPLADMFLSLVKGVYVTMKNDFGSAAYIETHADE